MHCIFQGRIVNSGSYAELSGLLNVDELVSVNEHRQRALRSQTSIRSSMSSIRHRCISESFTPATPCIDRKFTFDVLEKASHSFESGIDTGHGSAKAKRKIFAKSRDTHRSVSRLDSKTDAGPHKRFKSTLYGRQLSAISSYTGERYSIHYSNSNLVSMPGRINSNFDFLSFWS